MYTLGMELGNTSEHGWQFENEYWATPSGDLYIISDGREQLQMVIKVGTISQARSALNKIDFKI